MNGPLKKGNNKQNNPLHGSLKKYENEKPNPLNGPYKKEIFAISIAILVALLVIILTSSLSGSNSPVQPQPASQPVNQTPDIPTKLFSAGGISFEYPSSWNITTDQINGTNIQILIQDPASVSDPNSKQIAAFTILEVQNPNETLEQQKDDFIQSLTDNGANIAPSNSTNITVSGANANETLYTGNDPNYNEIQLKLVYFEQNNIYYIMAFFTKGMDLESQEPYFDIILNSFEFQ